MASSSTLLHHCSLIHNDDTVSSPCHSFSPGFTAFSRKANARLDCVSPVRLIFIARAAAPRLPFSSSFKPRTPWPKQEDPDRPPVNFEISAQMVRLVGEDGKLIGILPTKEALERAGDAELDLVQLDKQDPPCVKIIDYSKYKYELQKKKREQQKKNAANRTELKELKMRYNIDTHDYDVRLRAAEKFLKDGDKVKFVLQFKGREMEFKALGVELLKRFQNNLGELAVVESKLTQEGRTMTMILAPNKAQIDKSKQKQESAGKVSAV